MPISLNPLHKRLASNFARKSCPIGSGPLISFTFDDFPKSALCIAGSMLKAEGVRGTYYAALGLMGTDSSVGQIFTADDISQLLEDGHELASHTFHHYSCRKIGYREILKDCDKNQTTIAGLLGKDLGPYLRNFSFPYGEVRLTTKRALIKHFDTCRSIESGINETPVDLGFLKANAIYSHRPIGQMTALINELSRCGGWLIFYTHDISDRPSRFGCTPQYFQQVLLTALNSGAEILTIAQVVERISRTANSRRYKVTGEL